MRYKFKPLDNRHEWEWLSNRAKCGYCDDMRGVVAYRGNTIVAAVALDSWSETSCTIHVAIEDPMVLRHGFAHEVFNYVFTFANRKLIIGITPSDNKKALKFNKHIGFKEIYRIRDGYREGVDYVVQEYRKEDWLNVLTRHNRKTPHPRWKEGKNAGTSVAA